MKTKRFDRVFVSALIAVGLLGGMSGFTFGQMQVQQNGTALDANPQVGSGGSNTPVPGYVPINGNDIVTGNVAGLKYFHGQTATGTFSPYVFQGSQGSADFNNFARQSAPPSGGNYSAQSFYLPSTTVSTGQGSLYSAPRGSGFDSALTPRYSAAPTSNVGNVQSVAPVSEGIAIRQYNATPTYQDTTTGGNPVLTSPLFGARPQPIPGQALSVSLTPQSDADHSTSATPNGTSPGTEGATDTTGANNPNTTPDATTGNSSDSTTGGKSSAGGKSASRSVAPRPMINDAYRDLLKSLGQGSGEQTGSDANSNTTGTTGNPATPTDANRPANSRTGRPEIDPLTGKSVIPGVTEPGELPKESGTQSTDPTRPGYRPRSRIIMRSQLGSIPDSTLDAGKKVEPLKTFSSLPPGGGGTPFDVLMKNAEDLMRGGKYLQAADAYQQALTSEPDNALAVIGRADAELGAGMYSSAANDLKFLYTKQPALISVRHSLGEFIPVVRQQFLEGDLKSLTTNSGPGNNASFMLAYLYYNTGRMDEVKAELSRWDNRAWKDEWQGVLGRAWGK